MNHIVYLYDSEQIETLDEAHIEWNMQGEHLNVARSYF